MRGMIAARGGAGLQQRPLCTSLEGALLGRTTLLHKWRPTAGPQGHGSARTHPAVARLRMPWTTIETRAAGRGPGSSSWCVPIPCVVRLHAE